ncbi:MAG: mismatch repair protein MutL [Candidatus Sumerlaeota bacterium]|nr:mismatch repair protein MutL [Candidatus Sumerlaeota bacterium]
MKIQVLPQMLINQIAAGEVVVNMASVVKELVENSIDAGATRIEVELGNELRDVSIADDGVGMAREDAELCLQRHATSKIRTPEDLFRLATRGFRGEAVPSIASVSRVEIRTRPAEDLAGTRLVVEGGTIETIESVGCPAGTRISVRDLFFNTPARLKFLKSSTSEMNAILQTVVRQALAVPAIGFRIVRDGEVRLDLPSGQSLADRFLTLSGSRVSGTLLELSFEREGAAVSGLLANPQSSRGDRRSQYLFVNGRPFGNKAIGSSIEQACRGFIMTGRFPIFCVFITVPPGDVDINVHPTKEEVRFRNERNVAGACYHAARVALEAHGFVPEMHLDGDAPPSAPTTGEATEQPPRIFGMEQAALRPDSIRMSTPLDLVSRAFERKRAREAQEAQEGARAFAPDGQPVAPAFAPAIDPYLPRESPSSTPPQRRSLPPVAAGPGEKPDPEFWDKPFDPEPLGQIAETYVVARFGEDLLLVDQHAAHERLRFLELTARQGQTASQTLLVPVTFDVAADRTEVLEALLPELAAMGFAVEPFGGATWAATAVPSDLAKADVAALLTDLLDEFEDAPRVNRVADARERILVRAACHSSIRAGHRLSHEEMQALLDQMRACRLSFTCPHGRPTIIRLAKSELDRRFGRLGAH